MARALIRAAVNHGRSHTWGARAARTFAVNTLGVMAGLALQLVLARVLGVADYGRYIYVITWVAVLSMVCLLGFDAASLRFIAEHRARAEDGAVRAFLRFAQRRTMTLALAVAAVSGLLATSVHLAGGQTELPIYVVGAVLLPVTVLFLLHGYFLQGLHRADEALGLQLLVRPLLLILGCLALGWLLGRLDAAEALLLTLAVTATVAGLEAWRVRGLTSHAGGSEPDPTLRRQWSGTATSLFLVTVAQQILANGDILVVGLLIGTTDAGVYALAGRLAVIVSFATSAINFVLAPTIAGLHARGQRIELQAAITAATRTAFIFALAVLAVMVLGGSWLLGQFGTEFERGYPILALLCLGQAAVACNGATGFLLTMTGHHGPALRLIGFSAALMLVLAALLGLCWGAVGVAAAAATAQAVRSLALGRSARKHLGIRPSFAA